MIDKKTFKKTFADPFEKAGFRKIGQSWYLQGEDTTIAIGLQKSNYRELYYVNVIFWLNALGETPVPQWDKFHLLFRAEALFPDQKELILLACSLEECDLQLLSQFGNFLEQKLVPFLLACQHTDYLRTLLVGGQLENGLVHFEAREYLQGKSPAD